MCLFNRPEYTRQVLAHLAACRGIADYLLLPHIEPGCDETRALVEAVDFCECRPTWNLARMFVNNNTVAALDHGFTESDFVIHVEEDVLLAADALEYFAWAGEQYVQDQDVMSATGYHRIDEWPDPSYHHDVKRRQWFHPWSWATWKDRWVGWLRAPAAASGSKMTWDTGITGDVYTGNGFREVYPVLSRAQNIGHRSTIHNLSPEWFAENHSVKVWAGDSPVATGTFRETD
jgi:hypothetical protein